MSREKQMIEEMDLVVLNCYRNKYYTDGNSTEQGIIANAINDILPILVSLKNCEYRKQQEGEWKVKDRAGTSIGDFMVCSVCDVMIPTCDNDRYCLSFLDYCPRCGAKMKGGGE